jgi:hypothetical protein
LERKRSGFVGFGLITALAAAAMVAVRTPPTREKVEAISLKVLLTGDLLRDAVMLPLDEPDESLSRHLWSSAVYYASELEERIK